MSGTIGGKTFNVSAAFLPGTMRTWPLAKRLDIKRRLCAHLEGITQAAGYEFDLAPGPNKEGKIVPRVYRGRLVYGDSDPLPCISINEGPMADTTPLRADEDGRIHSFGLELFVQGWVATPDDNPTDLADQLLACVKKRLAEIVKRPMSRSGRPADSDIYMLGGRISAMQIGPGVVRPPQDSVSSWAFFYLPVLVEIGEDVSLPFVAA